MSCGICSRSSSANFMSLLISTNIYSMTLFLIFFLLIFFLFFFSCFLFRVCQSHWEAAPAAVGRQICGLLSCVNYLVSLPSRLLLLALSPSFFVGLCTSFLRILIESHIQSRSLAAATSRANSRLVVCVCQCVYCATKHTTCCKLHCWLTAVPSRRVAIRHFYRRPHLHQIK